MEKNSPKFWLSVSRKDDVMYTGNVVVNPPVVADKSNRFVVSVRKDKFNYEKNGRMNISAIVNGEWIAIGAVESINFRSEETRKKALALDEDGKSHAPCMSGKIDLGKLVPGSFSGDVVVFLNERTLEDGKKLILSFLEARPRETKPADNAEAEKVTANMGL